MLKVGLHANMSDWNTGRIARVLHAPLEAIGRDLSKEYGGTMKHLWIDFELIEHHTKTFPFRFQKKVGGSSPDKLTGLPREIYENVGHYSVRPDFQELRSVPPEAIVSYVLSLIYSSTAVLVEKQKKLGGFDAAKFRSDFLTTCEKHGYVISVPADPQNSLGDVELRWERYTEKQRRRADEPTSEASEESAGMTIVEHLCPERPREAEIASFSDWVQGTLPDDYQAFLKKENGGRPEPDGFRCTLKGGKVKLDTLNYFFGLHEGKEGSLRREFELCRERIPAGLLPIAVDPFGNLILLKIAEPRRGWVYFWDHEGEEDLPTLRNISKIAESFSEFVAGLEGKDSGNSEVGDIFVSRSQS